MQLKEEAVVPRLFHRHSLLFIFSDVFNIAAESDQEEDLEQGEAAENQGVAQSLLRGQESLIHRLLYRGIVL